ncbi:hypothetical protein [Kineococcus sp. SYSU DK005]|uniref:hypothetical protein n=1 Tax=Kineococcus sp. SYSU DK005 TaxID=3383126 RepID=UPI003D7CDFF4
MDTDAPGEELLAGALLAGPRGRRLLFELVDEASTTRGQAQWAQPAWRYDEIAPLPEELLEQLAQRLREAVAAVDLDALAARHQPHELLPALVESVGSARYWQHPDATDVALAEARVAEHLRPLAQAVARAPAAAWWSQPVDPGTQQHLQWVFEPHEQHAQPPGPLVSTGAAAAALARWQREAAAEEERARRERPRGVGANYSGTWWSSPPQLDGLLLSTPVLHAPDASGSRRQPLPVGMALLEDDPGAEQVYARAVRLREGVRVYEVHDASDWCALVAAHPRTVTYSRRHDWWRATGWDGAWALPDWTSVARQWDGVHLSVRGYLAVSGRLLATTVPGVKSSDDAAAEEVRLGAARTLLAGWSPAQTYWLTDVVADSGKDISEPVPWRATEDYPLRWAPGPAQDAP